jgi:hypothetical protein
MSFEFTPNSTIRGRIDGGFERLGTELAFPAEQEAASTRSKKE